MSELVHAIVILAHFHALSGFALGCGLNPEVDTPNGHTWEKPTVVRICTSSVLQVCIVDADMRACSNWRASGRWEWENGDAR